MKTLLFLVVFISGISFAQTNVIAAKSHASSHVFDKHDLDNFGNPVHIRTIETVKYLKEDCIVETYSSIWDDNNLGHDTICDHPFLQPSSFDLKRLKAMYPDETKFEGFSEIEKTNRKASRKIKKEKENKSRGLVFFLIGGSLFLIYLFIPKLSMNKS